MTDAQHMKIGMVGLGRMGANMARRLLKAGHQCRVYDVSEQAVRQLVGEGAEGAGSLADLVAGLAPPRTVWMMLPAAVTGKTVTELLELLGSGDAIVDGGNSSYRDDIDRAQTAASRGIDYVDCGTSGGVWGLEAGYCLMIGGPDRAVSRLEPIFAALAPGWRPPPGLPVGPANRPQPSRASCTVGRRARATSSRWSTTASSTP